MEEGRRANQDTKMRGCINMENKLTDIYLPRKCDYTDRLINSKDHTSIQLAVNDVNDDGTINPNKSSLITICGFVRSTGEGDAALQKILHEKKLI